MGDDRDLLFGAIAVQAGVVDLRQFAEACSSRTSEVTVADVLCANDSIPADVRSAIDRLVEARLLRCDSNPQASLSGYSMEIRSILASFGHGSVGGSITPDAQATAAYERGGPTEVLPERTGPRYRLSRLHAAGGIGEIWLAHDADLERDVAVKRLQAQTAPTPIALTRFLREARITGRLDHPGVVPVYEVCTDPTTGQPYYSMRFLKGRTLTEAVIEYHKRRRAGEAEFRSFLELLGAFCIVCNTVAYAHSKGVIHRDLKCDNVILGDFGEVVVIDWGLAKEVDQTEEHSDEREPPATARASGTVAGNILGTPAYMAPEQAEGRLDLVGPATDVYGLCAILYEILAGRPPFIGMSVLEVLQQVRAEDPTPPSQVAPGVPPELEKICLKGLAKLQADRHPSADALARAVQKWEGELAERRQAEEERERFFALSLDLLAIIDGVGRLRQVSPAWERLLGYDRDGLVGRPITELIHPEDRPAATEQLAGLATAADSDTFDVRVLAQDGTHRWVSWNLTPIAKEGYLYAVGRDVTELKRSQQLFEGVLQSAPDAMVLVSPDGLIALVNRQAENLFGYTSAEMVGQALEMLIPERYRAAHPAHVQRFFAESSFRPMGEGLSLSGRHKDGREFPVQISLSMISTEIGTLVAGAIRPAIVDASPRESDPNPNQAHPS